MSPNAWDELCTHQTEIAPLHMKQLWRNNRFEKFSLSLDHLIFDFSKHRTTEKTIKLLVRLAQERNTAKLTNDLLIGKKINHTEKRAALHTALRRSNKTSLIVNDLNVTDAIVSERVRASQFAENIRKGHIAGDNGQSFLNVVNIGTGGSDLGPEMTVKALTPYADGPQVHFVSNVDGAHLADTLQGLNPASTFFTIASKSFSTPETMLNAQNAKKWLSNSLGELATPAHFAALSANKRAAQDFGIPADRIFTFWEWVGGRYSIWSSVGLPLLIAIGTKHFGDFLSGAQKIDQHFLKAPLDRNIPVIMALLGVWYRNFFNATSHAILPYDQRLNRLPAYLQQLEMESNGKSITRSGQKVTYQTSPVIWGEIGTNAQHSFYQLLHQGTDLIPADILVAANPHEADRSNHDILLANAFAQAEALMIGRSQDEIFSSLVAEGMDKNEAARLAPHKTFPGNRPTSMILYRKLDPYTLGSLIALYEHKVFVQSIIWDINPFDQMGVELGKQLADSLLPSIRAETPRAEESASSFSSPLIAAMRKLRL